MRSVASSGHSVHRRHDRFPGPLHWWEFGEPTQPTLVLVHGFMAHGLAYGRVVEELARSYRLILPDLPGHGADESFRDGAVSADVEGIGGWLGEVLSLIPDPLHLVGHSLGGVAAFLAASEAEPGRIASLTLVNPGFRLPSSPIGHHLLRRLPAGWASLASRELVFRAYERFQWRGARMSVEELEDYLRPLRDEERLRFQLALGAELLRSPDRMSLLHPLEIPTRLMWGPRDRALSMKDAVRIRERLQARRLVVIAGAGHAPMEDRPEAFARWLRRCLAVE